MTQTIRQLSLLATRNKREDILGEYLKHKGDTPWRENQSSGTSDGGESESNVTASVVGVLEGEEACLRRR